MIERVSDFKNRLNEALDIRNMKPIELSEKTGISESTISQYRSGYAKPKERKLGLISDALDVNPVWLMGLDVPMEMSDIKRNIKIQPDAQLILDEFENNLILNYRSADEMDKRLVERVLRLDKYLRDGKGR